MSRVSRPVTIRCVAACIALALLGSLLALPAGADLPSSVASRVKRINTALVAADEALENDRLATAQRKLKEANRYFDEIKKRYAGKFDESDPEYTAMLERLSASAAKVATAESASESAAAAAKNAEEANEALCKEWIEKLRPFIDHDSDDCLRIGAAFNRSSPEQQAASRAAFPKAKALYEDLQSVSFPRGKSGELRNTESLLAGALKYYEREAADAAQEEACRQWVDTLAPYVDVGMGSSKRLIASATVDAQQIQQQQALYEEAAAVFAIYRKAEFPLGKTHRLQTLEQKMEQTLEEFPKAMAQSQAMISGDVATRLDGVLRYLGRDTTWKSDIKEKPPIVMERDLEPLREAVKRYAGTVAADDARLAGLHSKLADIEAMNSEHRAVRAQRTFQQPDGYKGSDLVALKDKAGAVAASAHPKAKILRVSVPSKDWVVEDVVEFTDTSKTALRRRITRSVRAEAVVQDPQGRVWLQGIYLGQDQLPSASGWGGLKGHTTWLDPMIADNVGRNPPS
jgi:hypothetical protein